MSEETELKLALAPEHVDQLRRHPVLHALKLRRASTKHLVSVYYDTPAFALLRNKVALRVRQDGRARIQTIKRDNGNGNGGLTRYELEQRIEGDQPDLSRVENEELRRLIEPHSAKGQLKPIFVTDVVRRIWPLRVGHSEIECALDVGQIRADGMTEPLCEVELELKAGEPAGLFELARRLNQTVPLRVERASKAARGYRLISGSGSDSGAGPQRADSVRLAPHMTARDAFAAIARACLDQMMANVEAAHLGEDPEGVHQLRVGIRRMRAAFATFRDVIPPADRAALGGELRWLQRALSPAREWDVLIAETIEPVAREFPEASGCRELLARAAVRRAEAYGRARQALTDARCTDLMLRLEGWIDGPPWNLPHGAAVEGAEPDPLDQPISELATALLRARHGKAHKLGRKIRKLDVAGLHALRIRVKKLRYVTEFFRDLYADKAAKRYIAGLKDLQEVLGRVHDAAIAPGLIAELGTGNGGPPPMAARHGAAASTAAELVGAGGPHPGDPADDAVVDAGKGAATDWLAAIDYALGLARGWTAANLHHDRLGLIGLWGDFARLKPFWKGE